MTSAEMHRTVLDQHTLERIDAYFRAANYLSVGQIYLRTNALLREPLRTEHLAEANESILTDQDVSVPGSAVRVLVLRSREDLVILKEVLRVTNRQLATSGT